jgi:hypothetical protein
MIMTELNNIAHHCRHIAARAGDKELHDLAKLVEELAHECEKIEKTAEEALKNAKAD